MKSEAIGRWALRASAAGLRPWPVAVLTAWSALVLAVGAATGRAARPVARAARARSRPGAAQSGPTASSSFRLAAGALALLFLATTSTWSGGAWAVFSAAASNVGNVFEAGYWAVGGATGELRWWGSGGYAQNGVDSTSAWTASAESTGATNWSQVSAGNGHTCAVRSDGTLWCWGHNDHGQLGLGDTTDRKVPTQVGAATTWSYVSSGAQHTCAIQIVNSTTLPLYCWGFNAWGQIGNGTTTDQLSPVQITGNWLTVTAGAEQTCAAAYAGAGATSGLGSCWGANRNGQLGIQAAETNLRTSPVAMKNSDLWISLASGTAHGCGVTNGGTLACWGEGQFGGTGDSGWARVTKSQQVGTDTNWAEVAVGAHHSCARKTTGTVWCMGLNTSGQLGQNDSTNRNVITQVGTGTWTALAAGGDTTCAVAGGTSPVGAVGSVWCWGAGRFGLFGNGQAADRVVPTAAASGTWSKLTVGPDHSCLLGSGAVSCAGSNAFGQLGRNSSVADRAPTATAAPTTINWTAISPGITSVCGIDTAAALWCWGANASGQVGNGTTTPTTSPAHLGAATWTSVSVGWQFACGVQTGGTLWCWGKGSRGQLGQGSTSSATSPQSVAVPSGQGGATWTKVGTGREHACGILSNGTLWCWGANTSGQLGVNDTTDRTTPTLVNGGYTNWTDVSLGALHTCGLRGSPGPLHCWGSELRSQTGRGTQDGSAGQTAPQKVPSATLSGSSAWTSVVTGDWHTCAMQGATLQCWGDDVRGQVGVDNAANPIQKTPITVTAPSGTWSTVTAGPSHTCATTTTRAIYCWGYNEFGQLGTTSTAESHTPAAVSYPGSTMTLVGGGNATFALLGHYTGTVLGDGPSGYWRLGEASGTSINAFTGGVNGTSFGTPTLGAGGAITGDPDTAITFAAGSSQRVAVGDVHDFDAKSPFTVEFWIKPTGAATANRQFAVAKERYTADNNRGGWAVLLSSTSDPTGAPGNRLVFGRYSGTGGDELAGTTTLSSGSWYHVAATYDGTTMKLYLNGALQSSVASSLNVENTTASLSFGTLQTSQYLSGTLDEVAVYGTALSGSRITAHYDARVA